MVLAMSNRRAHGPGIRAIRESLGIPHGKFAVAIGISPGYLTNVEKGVKTPSDAVVKSMALRLGVTVDQITYPVEAKSA